MRWALAGACFFLSGGGRREPKGSGRGWGGAGGGEGRRLAGADWPSLGGGRAGHGRTWGIWGGSTPHRGEVLVCAVGGCRAHFRDGGLLRARAGPVEGQGGRYRVRDWRLAPVLTRDCLAFPVAVCTVRSAVVWCSRLRRSGCLSAGLLACLPACLPACAPACLSPCMLPCPASAAPVCIAGLRSAPHRPPRRPGAGGADRGEPLPRRRGRPSRRPLHPPPPPRRVCPPHVPVAGRLPASPLPATVGNGREATRQQQRRRRPARRAPGRHRAVVFAVRQRPPPQGGGGEGRHPLRVVDVAAAIAACFAGRRAGGARAAPCRGSGRWRLGGGLGRPPRARRPGRGRLGCRGGGGRPRRRVRRRAAAGGDPPADGGGAAAGTAGGAGGYGGRTWHHPWQRWGGVRSRWGGRGGL